jgi:hypothetical protein
LQESPQAFVAVTDDFLPSPGFLQQSEFLQHSQPFSHLPSLQHLQSLQLQSLQQGHFDFLQQVLSAVHWQSLHSQAGPHGHALTDTD